MAKAKKLIRVYANPYGCEPDHEGRAHCHVHYEPSKNEDASMRFVGCRLVATQTVHAPPNAFGTVGPHDVTDFDHVWEYDTEPTFVPLTAYYLHHLRAAGHHGPALLAADAETWAIVHGDAKTFVDPKRRLAQYHVEREFAPRMKGCPEAPASDADGVESTPHVDHFRGWLGKHHTDAIAHDEARRNAKMEPLKTAPADVPTTPDSPQALHAAAPQGADR